MGAVFISVFMEAMNFLITLGVRGGQPYGCHGGLGGGNDVFLSRIPHVP